MENFKRPENNHKCCQQQDQNRSLAAQNLLMAFHTKLVNAPISIVCKALFQKAAFSMPVPLFSKGLFLLLRAEHEIIAIIFGCRSYLISISYIYDTLQVLAGFLWKKIQVPFLL